MSRLTWDGTGERFYQSGVSQGVFYPIAANGYGEGIAWNGLTSVNESPEGAEATDLWADNIKYATMRSAEDFKFSIGAYHYPDEFEECQGKATPTGLTGVRIGQQARKAFGLCYRTEKSNDQNVEGYVIHVIYNATCDPSDQEFTTINDSPDAIEFSWDCSSLPVPVAGMKPTSTMTFDSQELGSAKMTKLEELLYGSDSGSGSGTAASLPDPDTIIATLKAVT